MRIKSHSNKQLTRLVQHLRTVEKEQQARLDEARDQISLQANEVIELRNDRKRFTDLLVAPLVDREHLIIKWREIYGV